MRTQLLLLLVSAVIVSSLAGGRCAAETRKIVFIAGTPSHGYGAHEHFAGCTFLANSLRHAFPDFDVAVYKNGWPKDEDAFDGVDSVVIYADGGGGHPVLPHLEQVDELAGQGVGIVCIHYAVEVPQGPAGNKFLEWIGGHFETHWSVNPHWTPKFDKLPDHPITRGVMPFEIEDEWYYHMRFRVGMKGVTPILTATPGPETLRRSDGSHSGNPHVREAVLQLKEPQHMAWACEREDGGRGFGFTGGHFHWNWGDPNFRKLVLNAIAWTAHVEVPAGGVSDDPVTLEDLEANQDYQPDKNYDREAVRERLNLPSFENTSTTAPSNTPDAEQSRDSADVVGKFDVHEGLEATLFASEPMIHSVANIDIDHRGRVWVCEIVNYRGQQNRRPEGDRILILEDVNGDGSADKSTVFYQGRDIDSPHGVCVLATPDLKGTRVIVSAKDKVQVFTDENGDDVPDKQEVLFSGISGTQHDHGIHAFVFGPDGRLYFNFGNSGNQIKDAEGNVLVDKAGNEVRSHRNPYQQGMVFRCNLDASEFETLGWNFRNNWMVTVDSFGTMWQSDNDDDGNRGCRINYVMEYGNYGYCDEITGAGWNSQRMNLEAEVPERHWHLNDPGVVPNLLQTGAGSPTGITVYEGDLLPKNLWGQVIHCDAGPNVCRAYPVKRDGAGYTAEIVNVLHGARDQSFRPSDVKVAPDGSLMVADWHDPGVGGHGAGDLESGRIFRVAPRGHVYRTPTFDFSTADGAVQALLNPNYAVRYVAWTTLHRLGADAEAALTEVFDHSDNSRHRARALWLLGSIDERGLHYVERAIADDDEDIRIVGIRLARQRKLDVIPLVEKLAADPSPQVRRECLIALRHNDAPEMPSLWAELAAAYDGRDRWYLEALGISADRRWDACSDAWLKRVGDDWQTAAGRDIIWRSRALKTPELLAKIIANESTAAAELPRYFRAYDFLTGPQKESALVELASSSSADSQRQSFIIAEAFQRLEGANAQSHRALLDKALDGLKGTSQFIALVGQYSVKERYPELLAMAQAAPEGQLGVDAIRALLTNDERDLLSSALTDQDVTKAVATARALGSSADSRAAELLLPIVKEDRWDLELRRQATNATAKTAAGAPVILELARTEKLDKRLKAAASAPLCTSPIEEIRSEAVKLFPLPPTKSGTLPPLNKLVTMKGDADRGKIVFANEGACAKCHMVNNQGKEVGPNLSEIGGKLSRMAMFESIVYPSAGISHNYESFVLELVDGNVVVGVLVSQTDDSVTLKSEDAVTRTFNKSDVENMQRSSVSIMPAGIQGNVTTQDLVDVVEYLTQLKAQTTN